MLVLSESKKYLHIPDIKYIYPTDHTRAPNWVRIVSGTGVMPHYRPEVGGCGVTYPGWYDGEMPTEVGQMTKGLVIYIFSAEFHIFIIKNIWLYLK